MQNNRLPNGFHLNPNFDQGTGNHHGLLNNDGLNVGDMASPSGLGLGSGDGLTNEALIAAASPQALMDALGLLQQKIGALQTLVPLMSHGGQLDSQMAQQQAAAAAGVATVISQLAVAAAGMLPRQQQQQSPLPPQQQTQSSFPNQQLQSSLSHQQSRPSLPHQQLQSSLRPQHLPLHQQSQSSSPHQQLQSSHPLQQSQSSLPVTHQQPQSSLPRQFLPSPLQIAPAPWNAMTGQIEPFNHFLGGSSQTNASSHGFSVPTFQNSLLGPQQALTGNQLNGQSGDRENSPPGGSQDEDEVELEAEMLLPGSYELVEMDATEILAEHIHFCEICGKGFKRDANLRMHMRGHGDEYKTTAALSKPGKGLEDPRFVQKQRRYSCPYSGCKRNKRHRKFIALKTMLCVKNHYRRSHCPKMLTCSKCRVKKFSVVADLKTHEKHCGRDKWQCSCGTTFSRKDKLLGHLALFSGHTPAVPILLLDGGGKGGEREREREREGDRLPKTVDEEASPGVGPTWANTAPPINTFTTEGTIGALQSFVREENLLDTHVGGGGGEGGDDVGGGGEEGGVVGLGILGVGGLGVGMGGDLDLVRSHNFMGQGIGGGGGGGGGGGRGREGGGGGGEGGGDEGRGQAGNLLWSLGMNSSTITQNSRDGEGGEGGERGERGERGESGERGERGEGGEGGINERREVRQREDSFGFGRFGSLFSSRDVPQS